MPAPDVLAELVARFDAHRETYRSAEYNEAQLREEFLNPFFEALGWDVYNRKGYAGAYKEVIHEAALRIGGHTKAPDYAFRAGGAKASFFVEAKKPAVDIAEAEGPAYQLRRYAWSAKLSVSILTDFEELAVYDCRIRPAKTDKASTARVMYLRYSEYLDRWDELAGLFSPEAIRRGALERFIASKKVKKGTAEVDVAFLAEIETWRTELARNIALRNPALSPHDLNYAVQQTIDRIVFLRICEDRGIEPYGTLQANANGISVYRRLAEVFERADQRYNSGLFHFSAERDRSEPPDDLTLRLTIDDKPLQEIIRNLYFPDSPYEFSVIPAEILGQVYEQFLGKVIRLTKGHQAKVEEKPEVRKAGGVYYTPAYIVDYIVRQTVGRLLSGGRRKAEGVGGGSSLPPTEMRASITPKQAEKLRILDPACGSGSFLIGVYQHLLDWHRDWYVAHDPEKHARGGQPRLYRGPAGEWRLTSAERKRILLNNIYGVDIDPQAVEVTKLSLLLKVLEGESSESINNQQRLFHERALPDLAGNIKCGNSLIGPDFYNGQQLSLLDDAERARINVFDWQDRTLGFGSIMSAGGFDAVIGNPPYVLLQEEFRDDAQLTYFRSKFACASYKLDTYHLFIEQSVKLASVGGHCAMITPANFLTNNYLQPLRRLLLTRSRIDHILVIDSGVFPGISVDNAVYLAVKGGAARRTFPLIHARWSGEELEQTRVLSVSVSAALRDEHALFTPRGSRGHSGLWAKLQKRSLSLGSVAFVNFGKQLRDRREYRRDVIEVPDVRAIKPAYRPCYTGRNVTRYGLVWGGLACLNRPVARRGGCWDEDKQNARNKLLTRQIGRWPEFALDQEGYQCLNTVFMVNPKLPGIDFQFLLGILNSTLIRYLWLTRFYDQRRTFPKIKGSYLKQLPIVRVDASNQDETRRHDRAVMLVETLLSLRRKLPASRTAHQRTLIERQIAATDRQIDQLVYELYGLNEAEIALVEQSVAAQHSATPDEGREDEA